jgi:gephyrin
MRFEEARGPILAADVLAAEPHPPFRASIKDGYAVRAADAADAAGATLEVVGESRAGTRESVRVGPGQACYVTTGGPIPEGADAVVEVERTAAVGDGAEPNRRIRVLRAPAVGQEHDDDGVRVVELGREPGRRPDSGPHRSPGLPAAVRPAVARSGH